MRFYNDIDINTNQLKNSTFDKRTSAPSNPVVGQYYFNTSDNNLYVYSGSKWLYVNPVTRDTSTRVSLPDLT